MIYTQRIFWTQYNSSEKLERLLRFLVKHRDICHKISFFTEGDGMDFRYVPIEQVKERASFMEIVIRETRKAGFSPEINILNTLGHSDEIADGMPTIPWQGIVDDRGSQASQCSCPADAKFADYVYQKYFFYGKCKADLYWIDDDFRFNNHQPARWGCFCPNCLSDFSDRVDRKWENRDAFLCDLRKELSLRAEWIKRNHEVMLKLLSQCVNGLEKSMLEENYQIPIGLMTCDPTFLQDACKSLEIWIKKLAGKNNIPPWLRPGGGYWDDSNPNSLLDKLYGAGNAISDAGSGIGGSTYELENYPYAIGNKASFSTGLECLLAIVGTKLEGIMFDVLPTNNDPKYYNSWMTKLKKWAIPCNKANKLLKNTLPIGWNIAYGKKHFQNISVNLKDDLANMVTPNYLLPIAMQRVGLPITTFNSVANGTMLCGEAALGMSKEELYSLLEKPLIIDGKTAERYIELGLGDCIGLKSVKAYTAGVFEKFSDDPVSLKNLDYRRTATLTYYGLTSYELKPIKNTRILSHLCQISNGQSVGAAMTLSADKAPVAVLGHMPWNMVLVPARIEQLRNLSEEMFDLNPALTLHGGESVVFWLRADKNKTSFFAVLFNAGFDDTEIRLKSNTFVLEQAQLKLGKGRVAIEHQQNIINISLSPWAVAIIELQK